MVTVPVAVRLAVQSAQAPDGESTGPATVATAVNVKQGGIYDSVSRRVANTKDSHFHISVGLFLNFTPVN